MKLKKIDDFSRNFFSIWHRYVKIVKANLEIPTEKIREIEKTKDDFFWEFLFILHFWFR